MARIIVGSWFVRYPMGGNLSCVLQYLTGFQRLGHDVYFVEKSGYPQSCYDPVQNAMTDCCAYGVHIVRELLSRYDLQERFCYVDEHGQYHGLSREQIETIFKTADLFVEMGTHEAWLEESSHARMRILIDGDPGFSQIWMEQRRAAEEPMARYDYHFTVGGNVGRERSTAPTGGAHWRHIYHPVNTDLFPPCEEAATGSFTT
jgi:hypothetical protein